MRRGELAVFTLQSDYGYGPQGSPPKIPPNAVLIFEIELFDWRLEDLTRKKDGGVRKSILQEGEGYSTPNEGSIVNVHILGKYEDNILEERDVSFVVGEASEENLIEGLDVAVVKMKKGEKSRIFIRKDYAWGSNIPENFSKLVPADYEQVVYDLTLKEFEKRKESWEMTDEERIEQATIAKNRGSSFFKQGKYQLALKQYKRITQYIGPPEGGSAGGSEAKNPEKNSVLLAGYLNLAATYLKMNKHQDAIKNSDLALDMDANNEKGLFRRGCANLMRKEYEVASKDFSRILELDPKNTAAKTKLNECNVAIKEFHKKQQALYKNMFDVFAKRDKEKEEKAARDVWRELKDEQKRDFKSNNGTTGPSDSSNSSHTTARS